MFPGKTLVLGGGGFLGSYFSHIISSDSVVHLSPRGVLNPRFNQFVFEIGQNNLGELGAYILKQDFACVINCIANANIEDCEQHPERAYFLNAELPRFLAELTEISGTKLVHFSTDAIFDGINAFKKESDLPKPQTTYGKSKLYGEDLVTSTNPDALIARVNFFGLSKSKISLFNYFYYGLLEGRQLNGYSNIYFTPLYIEETVNSIQKLVELNQSGIIHVAGSDRLSKLDFGKRVARVWSFDEGLINPVDYQESINRALDLSLDTTKLSNLGIEVPSLEQSLVMMRTSNIWSSI